MANKIFLYILLYIVLAFFLTSLYYFIKRLIIAKKIETDTKAFIENLGYVTCVCGQQGSGKTTFSSGVANLYVELLQKKANDTIINFSAMFPKFDLKEINEVIHDGFVNGKTPIQILTTLREKNIVDDEFLFSYIDDSINYEKAEELLKDYIEATIALYRNNYVYYLNKDFYSRITENYAMSLDYKSIAIKDRYLTNDYNLTRYSLLFQDELVLNDGSNMFWQTESKADTGVSDFFRLIRHIGKETISFIGTTQDFTRINASRRELFTSILEIYDHKEVKVNGTLKFLLMILETFVRRFFDFYYGCFEDENKRFEKNSMERKFNNFIYKINKYIESKSYISYSGVLYRDPNDYLKTKDKAVHGVYPFKLYLPLSYCFGCIDTHQFSIIQDLLTEKSNNQLSLANIYSVPNVSTKIEMAKGILAKRKSMIINDVSVAAVTKNIVVKEAAKKDSAEEAAEDPPLIT